MVIAVVIVKAGFAARFVDVSRLRRFWRKVKQNMHAPAPDSVPRRMRRVVSLSRFVLVAKAKDGNRAFDRLLQCADLCRDSRVNGDDFTFKPVDPFVDTAVHAFDTSVQASEKPPYVLEGRI